jgi:hypothetical protein
MSHLLLRQKGRGDGTRLLRDWRAPWLRPPPARTACGEIQRQFPEQRESRGPLGRPLLYTLRPPRDPLDPVTMNGNLGSAHVVPLVRLPPTCRPRGL